MRRKKWKGIIGLGEKAFLVVIIGVLVAQIISTVESQKNEESTESHIYSIELKLSCESIEISGSRKDRPTTISNIDLCNDDIREFRKFGNITVAAEEICFYLGENKPIIWNREHGNWYKEKDLLMIKPTSNEKSILFGEEPVNATKIEKPIIPIKQINIWDLIKINRKDYIEVEFNKCDLISGPLKDIKISGLSSTCIYTGKRKKDSFEFENSPELSPYQSPKEGVSFINMEFKVNNLEDPLVLDMWSIGNSDFDKNASNFIKLKNINIKFKDILKSSFKLLINGEERKPYKFENNSFDLKSFSGDISIQRSSENEALLECELRGNAQETVKKFEIEKTMIKEKENKKYDLTNKDQTINVEEHENVGIEIIVHNQTNKDYEVQITDYQEDNKSSFGEKFETTLRAFENTKFTYHYQVKEHDETKKTNNRIEILYREKGDIGDWRTYNPMYTASTYIEPSESEEEEIFNRYLEEIFFSSCALICSFIITVIVAEKVAEKTKKTKKELLIDICFYVSSGLFIYLLFWIGWLLYLISKNQSKFEKVFLHLSWICLIGAICSLLLALCVWCIDKKKKYIDKKKKYIVFLGFPILYGLLLWLGAAIADLGIKKFFEVHRLYSLELVVLFLIIGIFLYRESIEKGISVLRNRIKNNTKDTPQKDKKRKKRGRPPKKKK
ncbi:hypothetical protein DRN58_00510 [Thermococci archaeon]|nr:MAG: hypothetical protein DRN58_00510 [Thermococci archaeon]